MEKYILALIDAETKLQAKGVGKLLELENKSLSKYVIVSVGSGSSYTFVDGDNLKKFPFGNPISGGSLIGEMHSLGIESYQKFSELASNGKPQNLKFRDVFFGIEGPMAEYLISSKGKLEKISALEDKIASSVGQVGFATALHLLMINGWPGWDVPNDIVYIGTAVAKTPALRESLSNYTAMIGKTTHFPEKGQYALALGAMLSDSEE